MKRKQAEFILTVLGVAEVVATFYTIYPPVAIALTPLAIYCLIIIYNNDAKNSKNKPNA
ncbi:hypothetical protein [Nostoc sp.]|uniref:hypothetical protein n=1 Tax=Nostoc sp. TaxID=1180 RepID=UPI002FFA77C7